MIPRQPKRLPPPPPACVDCGGERSRRAKRCLPCEHLRRQRRMMARLEPDAPLYQADPFEDCPELLGAFLPHPPWGGLLDA